MKGRARRGGSLSRARVGSLGAGLAAALHLSPAEAGGALGGDGTPIRTSQYGVDLTQTPVLAGARVTGLAGAYVALAEGVDGDIQNPAAPAVRPPYSVDHVDYDLGLGLTLPASLTSTDFFNTGRGRTQLSDARQGGFVFVNPAANLMWGRLGLGAALELQNYTLRRSDDTAGARKDRIDAQFLVTHLQAANLFAEGALSVGVGLRILSLAVTNPNAPSGQGDLFTTEGAGIELGALLMPRGAPYRIGASFRSGVVTEPNAKSRLTPNADGDRIIGGAGDPQNAFWLPDRVAMPWDLNVGVALQFGPRPLNPRWTDPRIEDERERRRVLGRSADRTARREMLERTLRQEHRLTPEAEEAIAALLDSEEATDELHLEHARQRNLSELKLRSARLPRPYVLLTMSVVVTGTAEDAVGVESFLQRVVARSGARVVYSPRLGVETELVPNWLKIRAGTYGEPSRFATSRNRLHGTLGFDSKLFPWTVFGLFDDETEWRAGASLDAAPRYLGWGVSVGVWH